VGEIFDRQFFLAEMHAKYPVSKENFDEAIEEMAADIAVIDAPDGAGSMLRHLDRHKERGRNCRVVRQGRPDHRPVSQQTAGGALQPAIRDRQPLRVGRRGCEGSLGSNMGVIDAGLDCQKGRYDQGIKALVKILAGQRISHPPG
jgi:hypothetical protein